ncbi:MAG: hypothetical protein ACT6TH_09370 [Brevundimonas sp.]|uniref:hypothetical protein n=1 Tax=Brevundimonas sp. TaxID=1871086 RepID=UPI00403329B8
MNILLIALHYHDYTANIARELRELGHEVRVHDIMPRTLFMKALRLIAPRLWQTQLNRHHARILRAEAETPTDLVLFIQAHQMSKENMAGFRSTFRSARFALYNWDSIANHDYLPHLASFDDVFTFDPDDARRHSLRYLPLFCSREFQGLRRREQDQRAIYFVGNIVNPARYRALDAFRDYCDGAGIQLNAYMACTPPMRVKLKREGIVARGLSSRPIDRSAFIDMVETSVAVFDFANHHQSGYTMRVFENLCAGKKIITNNPRVRQEAFYSPDRFHVFDGLDFTGVAAFVQTPLRDPDAEFPEYHIQTFVKHLVDGTSHSLPQHESEDYLR